MISLQQLMLLTTQAWFKFVYTQNKLKLKKSADIAADMYMAKHEQGLKLGCIRMRYICLTYFSLIPIYIFFFIHISVQICFTII